MNLPNGHILQNGKYQITQAIGQGGFGITYQGIWFTEVKGSLGTIRTEVPICIKEYFFKDYCYREEETWAVKVHSETGRMLFDKFKEKLIKEAKILSEVHHPHIVNVLEVFEENHTAYIAMEYITGSSLKSLLDKEGKLPEAEVLGYVHQIGDALQFVHDKHILHLDIKPSNILVDTAGQTHLIDFGVSKRYDIEQQETSTTMLTLSKGFASIEQYDSEGIQHFSPCPDIYSLGATMYNLLTGKIPTESILRATRPLQKPSEFNASISPKTEAVIMKAMELIPANRFQTVREMMDALDFPPEKKETPTQVLPPEEEVDEEEETTLIGHDEILPPGKIGKGSRKKKIAVISVILCMLVGIALAYYLWRQPKQPPVGWVSQMPVAESSSTVSEKESTEIADTTKEQLPSTEEVQTQLPPQTKKESDKEVTTIPKQAEHPRQNTGVSGEKPADKLHVSTGKEKETERPIQIQPSPEVTDAQYAALITSGKEKMQQSDFENARKDFTQAKAIKLTEEVLRLLITCDEQEAVQQLADRKAQYEIKMPFGKVTIVRKKSTRLYGAIDADAHEKIPCRYVNVGISENGRAFEREDGLYDIYNKEGILINEGTTNY